MELKVYHHKNARDDIYTASVTWHFKMGTPRLLNVAHLPVIIDHHTFLIRFLLTILFIWPVEKCYILTRDWRKLCNICELQVFFSWKTGIIICGPEFSRQLNEIMHVNDKEIRCQEHLRVIRPWFYRLFHRLLMWSRRPLQTALRKGSGHLDSSTREWTWMSRLSLWASSSITLCEFGKLVQ